MRSKWRKVGGRGPLGWFRRWQLRRHWRRDSDTVVHINLDPRDHYSNVAAETVTCTMPRADLSCCSCPKCGAELEFDNGTITCTRCNYGYDTEEQFTQ